ncbi:GAF domain-containing protein [Rhodohalobacter sp. SW132]|uniref:chemotaxis protein CheB n=1 Tax=Rhodohalobacter sp. SW132 TaxID=2293433 RepID=UPI000E287C53|nr:chemotaxis protein CheB [Rhodohalobacter sp. SW132]REL32934.1 GAF domain-containing protein [Rhodohalobacter sp. SW132]
MSTNTNKYHNDEHFLVVGLGASAGGLKPLQEFFRSLPAETDMAFIVVQHLTPDKESNLSEILQRETELKVTQVYEKTNLRRNQIYVIPPSKLLSVEDNQLELSDPKKEHGIASIDHLFRTLAKMKHMYAAGILFSGSGSDGITGMKIIKEHGGITIAQDPKEAQHSSMPLNAIKTGAVDKVLPVKDMADELKQYFQGLTESILSEIEDEDNALAKILDRIQSRNDHDFSNYRRPSVLRRIGRRLRVTRSKNLAEYLAYIDKNPDEIDELYKDLLISVTQFFRDSEAFKALANETIPALFEGKDENTPIRVWVPGCATGEEAYSLAILLYEHASELDYHSTIEIFATDVDREALYEGRAGRYPKSIVNDISPERLRRFFKKNQDGYIINDEIRQMVLFATHDVLRNPPFSKLDLISCRNLLIYLNQDLQSEVFNLFHYALRENGWLFLGTSDTGISGDALFNPVTKNYRIYQKKAQIQSRNSLPVMPLLYKTEVGTNYKRATAKKKDNIEKVHWSLLAGLYAPESVLITKDFDVIHSTDGIKKFLEYSGGEPSRNILDMVKPGIRQDLRNILHQLKNSDSKSVERRISTKEGTDKLVLIARIFTEKNFPTGLIHVVFKEIAEDPETDRKKGKISKPEATDEAPEIILSLENELEYTRQQLRLSVEEYEASIEELKASNEELQSMNEELQSTTEELETSKEELQSVNEELKTVNDQLESKVEELHYAHSDLENLIEATEIGIIFVDRDLCIQRFTPAATGIFNLIDTDKKRPLQHITHSLDYDTLLSDIEKVQHNGNKIKKTVTTKDGRWFMMKIRPYCSFKDNMEGAVLSFEEFTELKEARDIVRDKSLQESLATLGVYVLEHDDLDNVMHRALQQSCAILNLKCAAIMEYDEQNDSFKVANDLGCGCQDTELENDETWDLGYSLNAKEPVTVLDYQKENRFRVSPFLAESEVCSSVHISIRGSNSVYGVFAAYTEEKREFTKQELHYIQVVANILGRTIEQHKNREKLEESNTRLQNEIERSEQLQREIITNSVHDRWELGGYLHDNLGQLLATIKILVDDIRLKTADHKIDLSEEVKQFNKMLDMCINSIRDMTHWIIPVDIENEGVERTFRFLMTQTSKLYSANCKLKANNQILDRIKNREAATHLYHIVQEACKNAAIHGKAETIVVSVYREDDHFILQIKDDGISLKDKNNNKGKGLRIMKHRMDLLGGTFNISNYSDEGASGTVVTCKMPMKNLRRVEAKE